MAHVPRIFKQRRKMYELSGISLCTIDRRIGEENVAANPNGSHTVQWVRLLNSHASSNMSTMHEAKCGTIQYIQSIAVDGGH